MQNDYNLYLGKKIKELRRNKKISMAKLGELVGLHESTINRYEQGNIKELSISKIIDFAQALGTKPSYLIGIDKDIFYNTDLLNDEGIKKVQSYINDLLLSDKYKRSNI